MSRSGRFPHRLGFRLLAISAGRAHLGHRERAELLGWLERLGRDLPAAAVQLREKRLDDRAAYQLCVEARARFPGTLLVNSRADLALASSADGVHLTSTGPSPQRIAEHFGEDLLIGLSAHSTAEVVEQGRWVDYVCLGPLFSTPSKPGAAAIRVEELSEAAGLGTPVLALGGIDGVESVRAAFDAGAHGIAGIRLFQDPAQARSLFGAAGFPELES
ncbi:MAG TPA: thiamine phosphate synthase [Thermoanaerobaculia bacterium]|nr:thiamine phosphate synthase [Thermoanaerobaculia bacterium]